LWDCLPTIANQPTQKSRGSRWASSGSRGQQPFTKEETTTVTTATSSLSISSNSNSSSSNNNSNNSKEESLSIRFAKWTKKVSGITCGAATTLTSDESTSILANSKSRMSERPMPEKPPRASKALKKNVDADDHDHHTFATATTASATISYSTDQGDASDASEVGMEVIMSSRSRDSTNDMEDVMTYEPYRTHTFTAGKHTFTVDQRYSLIRTIGSGAYGVVISVADSKTDTHVAIKMVPKAFSDEIDAKRILREIKLLKHFRHENIVRIVDMMPPGVKYLQDFTDVYLVADLMETDLHRIIYSKQKLSMDHVQYFIYQVLRGLKYIHQCQVLHRDLKPSNLLVNSNCDLKICDFGLARGIHETNEEGQHETMLLTEYVVTRWYRAPEIMLACHEYSYPIDVWSVGCIFAELILRKPYFPGDDYIHQVSKLDN
jgi:tRNA A-37 threonylcarbamoyl transferase component Bud32